MTANEFEQLGYRMIIWPVSALRMAAKAHEELYAALAATGWVRPVVDRMQTRAELYATIGYHEYEELDGTIARSVVPTGKADG
jgi:methylisocitrate lyase